MENTEEDMEVLFELEKEQLVTIILWTLRDLNFWATDKRVSQPVRGNAAMLEEAVRYQINKAVQIKEVIAIPDAKKEEE